MLTNIQPKKYKKGRFRGMGGGLTKIVENHRGKHDNKLTSTYNFFPTVAAVKLETFESSR